MSTLTFDHPNSAMELPDSDFHDAIVVGPDTPDVERFVEERLHAGTRELYAETLAWMERRLLVRVLRETAGNQSKACHILGITRGSLRHKIRQLRISINQVVALEDNGLLT